MFLKQLEAGITDLFAFPDGDSLILIVCVRRGLAQGTPLPLEPYTYRIHLDLHSQVDFDDSGVLGRYGGKVRWPGGIAEDVTITVQLADRERSNTESGFPSPIRDPRLRQTMIRSWQCEGLPAPEKIRIWAGVCDDPFIFHRFSTTNCVAMVVEIPFSQFADEQQDFLVWATSHRYRQQIDHVGRSLRTMLPRFELLNTLHPSQHVARLRQRHERPGPLADVGAKVISPLLALRHYDFEPDVMIWTRRQGLTLDGQPYGRGYPNGRRLEDDVAWLCCEQGDCLLYEISLAEAHAAHQSRPTANGRPFLDRFPYLLEANTEPVPFETPRLRWTTWLAIGTAAMVIGLLFLLPWWLWYRERYRGNSVACDASR